MDKLQLESEGSHFDRRSFLRATAGVAVSAAAALVAPAANASNWRGLVGCVKPRADSASLVELIRLLPEGIGIVPVYNDFAYGTREELANSYGTYEKNIAYLAAQHCDLISIEGAPPFMILGAEGEAKMVDGWKQKYKVDMFTSSQNQVNVLNAMKIKKILGITAFGADLNKTYAKYFEDRGVSVAGMEGIEVAFNAIGDVPSEAIYEFIKKKLLALTGVEGIYVLGSSLQIMPITQIVEQDFGIPVIGPVAARIWEIQRRLHVHQPVRGHGRLLETMPV